MTAELKTKEKTKASAKGGVDENVESPPLAPSVEASRFSCRTSTPKQWQTIANAAKLIVEDFTLEATPEGLRFSSMDPSHIQMLVLDWPAASFQSYSCPEKTLITLRMDDFQKLLSRAKDKDAVEIYMKDDDSVGLKFVGDVTKTFALHVLESPPNGLAPVPKLEMGASFKMDSKFFETILGDLSIVADQVKVAVSAESLTFSARSDAGDGEIILDPKMPPIVEFKVDKPATAAYNIGYVLSMVKICGKDVPVGAAMTSKKPIELTFPIDEQGGKLRMYLAPRFATE